MFWGILVFILIAGGGGGWLWRDYYRSIHKLREKEAAIAATKAEAERIRAETESRDGQVRQTLADADLENARAKRTSAEAAKIEAENTRAASRRGDKS